MKKFFLIFFVLVLLGNITSCQESTLKLKLSLSSANIVLGEPLYFTVTLCNEGNEAIQMAPGETEGDFSCHIFTRRPDGKIIEGVGAGIAGSLSCPAMPKESVPPKECRKTAVVPFVSCLTTFNKAGKYELWMEYETSTGIILSQLKRPISEEPVKYWKGSLRSNVCSLDVIEPTGTDRIAYEKWLKPYALREKSLANYYTGNGDTLLQDGTHQFKDVRLLEEIMRDYPTSTYAAYAMFGNPGSPRVAMTPEDFLENVHKPKFLNRAFKTDDNKEIIKDEKGENIWLTAEDIQRGIIEKGELILRHHPDFVYRDELRFRIAQAHIALYEEKKAVKLFEEIACDAMNEADRLKAKRYVELLVSIEQKEKPLTDDQSEPKKQEMKESLKK